MNSDDRVKKDDPPRDTPYRDFSNLFTSFTRNNFGGDATSAWADNVDHGVKLGYRVIEEHIAQGRRVAQDVNNRNYGAESMNNDIREFAERTQQYVSDVSGLYMKTLQSLSNNMSANGFAGAVNGSGARSTDAQVNVVMASKQPLEVSVELQDSGEDLTVDYLHAKDPNKAPLRDVKLEHVEGKTFKFHITVPDDQPAGQYRGVVYSAKSDKACGTVTATLND
ncbi:MAG: hypothetical protein AAF420_00925 [Pseudomonadota bacterium]